MAEPLRVRSYRNDKEQLEELQRIKDQYEMQADDYSARELLRVEKEIQALLAKRNNSQAA